MIQSYLPYDTGWMCARFQRHFKPRICILMETEVWSNMIKQCVFYCVPVMLANARLSERSLRRGKTSARSSVKLRRASIVLPRSRNRMPKDCLFGARQVHVTGSIKFDVEAPPEMIALGRQGRVQFGERPVLLRASTREGEEELILSALKRSWRRDFLVVIVTRHPQRFDDVAALIHEHGFSFLRRSAMSEGTLAEDISIVLGDSMGEMFFYYAACDVAFIGGSIPPLGGQNLIEACMLAKPVLIGSHTFNFKQISNDAVNVGGAFRVENADELMRASLALFENHDDWHRASTRAAAFVESHSGATAKTMDLLKPYI